MDERVADAIELIDRLTEELKRPLPLRARVGEWLRNGVRTRWRLDALGHLALLRARLAAWETHFHTDAHHLVRWLDWDRHLSAEGEPAGTLAARLQHRLWELSEPREAV